MAGPRRDDLVLDVGRARRRFEQVWRWRQAAQWAPVVWFPLVLFRLLMREPEQAIALGLAGIVFAALARAVVWRSRCPSCDTRFGDSPAGLRRVWNEATCGTCGVCLFELRRGRAPH